MESPPPPAHQHQHQHQRHWPLDLPSGLPFDRYEHRRLTARDILVHRIMTALLAPATIPHDDNRPPLSAALAAQRQPSPRAEMVRTYDPHSQLHQGHTRTTIPFHNFAGLKMASPALARDVEVLRKMLVTRSPSEWVRQSLVKPAKAVSAWPRVLPPVTTSSMERFTGASLTEERPSVEEEALELVRMHYLEMDDPVTRLWLGMVDMPRRSVYQTLPKMPAKEESHKELVQKRVAWEEQNQVEEYKKWYREETAHLRALQSQTNAATERALYDGGSFLPRFQHMVMASKISRARYLNNMMEMKNQSCFSDEHNGPQIQDDVYPWPEGDVPRRVLHVPSVYSWRQKQHFFRDEMPSVDFASGRTGRGLDRDGIWSTSRWYGDDAPRGRTARRARRRATSEPPPGIFTATHLPVSFNSTRELMIFPKMSLSTMERRTRRRSLSRTRIAEMFDWDITLDDPPPKRLVPLNSRRTWTDPLRNSARRRHYDDATQQPTPFLENKNALWAELHDNVLHREISIRDAITYWGTVMCTRNSGDYNGLELIHLSKWCGTEGVVQMNGNPKVAYPSCSNCASKYHETKHCRHPCGYCGAPNPNVDYNYNSYGPPSSAQQDDISKPGKHDNPHLASNCPVARHNRCKCGPFPQFHTAAKCLVLCSRPCGNTTHPPGHFKHRNAMSCTSRCCICGMRGHSGIKCKYMTCRCGGKHLGQTCGWQPACRVAGCNRYHCGIHCGACGVDRHRTVGGDVVLVDGLCPACLNPEGDVVSSQTASGVEKGKASIQRGSKRRRVRKEATKTKQEEKPWYAPLEPRTKPVVGSKSGKSAAKRDTVGGEAEVKIGGCR